MDDRKNGRPAFNITDEMIDAATRTLNDSGAVEQQRLGANRPEDWWPV